MEALRKVALITGASSGIGAGTAIHFAKLGYRLALNGRKMERLEGVANKCKQEMSSPKDVLLVPGDVRDPAVAKSAVKQTVDNFGQLDLLINNAGTVVFKSALECTTEDIDFVMDTNVKAAALWTQEAAPHLIKAKGNIVNVSSNSSVVADKNMAFYCASKAALDMLTKCLANEMGPKGVRVNAVNPGQIQTNIHEQAGLSYDDYQGFLDMFRERLPVQRVGEVEEVARAIAYFASEHAGYINGATLFMDGGEHNMIGVSQ